MCPLWGDVPGDGWPGRPAQLEDVEQGLDLWSGLLTSRFRFERRWVAVRPRCHPDQDLVAVWVESPLLQSGGLRLVVAFPYGSDGWGPDPADWS